MKGGERITKEHVCKGHGHRHAVMAKGKGMCGLGGDKQGWGIGDICSNNNKNKV